MPDLLPRRPLVVSVAVAVVAIVVAWRVLPVASSALVATLVSVVGTLCGASLAVALHAGATRTRPRFGALAVRPGPQPSPRAKDLAELEEVVDSALRYDHDVHLKLRPHLRRLAAVRLAGRRIDIDRDPAARRVLGEAYDIVRADARRPQGELFGPGIPIERLEQVIETMERL